MSNVNAILKGRSIKLADGVCLERAYEREMALEEYLRALVAHLPKMKPLKRQIRRFVADVNSYESEFSPLSDDDLVEQLNNACIAMRRHGLIDKLLARSFAAIREASSRTLGMRHHDVQLIGGWVLLQGMIAEMETGEGKTLEIGRASCRERV